MYFTYSTLQASKAALLNDLYIIEECRSTNAANELFQACKHFTKDHDYADMSWVITNVPNAFMMGAASGEWRNYSI
ncbi:hypothetical protein [Jeotgalibacillus soli]|uniref:hypothetical protein n=1 Tax=Jeotgalibacillus soli TaxID=889306 RepID=UPI001F22A8D6|nr:hypothetical protein [Jeotgalibacillus soli]